MKSLEQRNVRSLAPEPTPRKWTCLAIPNSAKPPHSREATAHFLLFPVLEQWNPHGRGRQLGSTGWVSDKTLQSHMALIQQNTPRSSLTQPPGFPCAQRRAHHQQTLLGGSAAFQHFPAASGTAQLPLIGSITGQDSQDQVRNSATFNYSCVDPSPVHSRINLATKQPHRSPAESGLPGPAAGLELFCHSALWHHGPIFKSPPST